MPAQWAHCAWKEAAGAEHSAPQFVGNEFQTTAEVGNVLDRINQAGAKFNRSEYGRKGRKRVQGPDQHKIPATQQNGLSDRQAMFQVRSQQRTKNRTDTVDGEDQERVSDRDAGKAHSAPGIARQHDPLAIPTIHQHSREQAKKQGGQGAQGLPRSQPGRVNV